MLLLLSLAELLYPWLLALFTASPLSEDAPGVAVTAGLRWFACDANPVLPVDTAGRLSEDEPLPAAPWTVAAVLRTAVLPLRIAGVVLTIDDLLAEEDVPDAIVLSEALILEDDPPEACALLAVLLPAVLLFLLTVLLVPMPPLSEVPLLNTRSDSV